VENLQVSSQKLSGFILTIVDESEALANLVDGLRFFSPYRRIQSDSTTSGDLARRAQLEFSHGRLLEVSRWKEWVNVLNP